MRQGRREYGSEKYLDSIIGDRAVLRHDSVSSNGKPENWRKSGYERCVTGEWLCKPRVSLATVSPYSDVSDWVSIGDANTCHQLHINPPAPPLFLPICIQSSLQSLAVLNVSGTLFALLFTTLKTCLLILHHHIHSQSAF